MARAVSEAEAENIPTVWYRSLFKTHLVLSNPSTPTGPRAWIRPVEIPTSAPRPNLQWYESVGRAYSTMVRDFTSSHIPTLGDRYVPVTVRESWRGIVKHTGGINGLQKRRRGSIVLCHNDVCMSAAESNNIKSISES